MRIFSSLTALLRNLSRRGQVERDLAEELDAYLDLSTNAKMREGMEEGAALRAAKIELGGVEQLKEEVRAVRMGQFMETRLLDLRYGFRTLRKAPLFSLTVVLVLATGIGSTALMFALVNSLLLRGPGFPEADRLYMLWQKIPQEERTSFSPNEFSAWQKQAVVFEQLASFTGTGFTITGRG